jgi:hypothetical protein
MIIESAIGLLILATVVYLFWQSGKTNPNKLVDVNKDGKVNIEDAKAALDKVVAQVVEKVDVNQDGKISVADAETVLGTVKESVKEKLSESETKLPKRARNKGKLVADNPATPDVNEAWESGKAPDKKAKPKKPKKPKMTVAK